MVIDIIRDLFSNIQSAPAMNEVIILGPEKNVSKRIAIRDLKGIEIRAAVSEGVFTYELKVRLVATPEFPLAYRNEKEYLSVILL